MSGIRDGWAKVWLVTPAHHIQRFSLSGRRRKFGVLSLETYNSSGIKGGSTPEIVSQF